MNYTEIQNTRALTVKFLGPTNYKGSRIKITDAYNKENKQSLTLSYCYKTGNVLQQAIDVLTLKGFKIVSRASTPDTYVLCVDNWGDNYINLK